MYLTRWAKNSHDNVSKYLEVIFVNIFLDHFRSMDPRGAGRSKNLAGKRFQDHRIKGILRINS